MGLIYAGKTEDSHPEGIKFPYAFGVTHSENHYSNKTLAHQDLTGVIVLHAKQKCEELEQTDDHKCLIIFYLYKSQIADVHWKLLDKNNFVCVFVLPNLTNYFQPLYLKLSSHVKMFLKDKLK